MFRTMRSGAVLLTFVLALTACGAQAPAQTDTEASTGGQPSSGEPSGNGSPTTGGTLVVGIGGYPSSLNPNLQRSAVGYSLHRATLDTLTFANSREGGELQPSLAESWELIDDTTWQFKLRQDVLWHDGTPFTADDVVATVDLVLNGDPPAQYRNRISSAIGAEKVDDYTVNVMTAERSSILPVGFADIYIHQAKQIEEGGNEAISANPIGTGQFKISEREEGVSITVVRNDDYWGEPAFLDAIEFRNLTEDATRVAALESGEIDIAYNVPPDDAARLEESGDVTIMSVPLGQSMMVQWALNSPQIPDDHPLADVRVRQALNYAVDKQSLVDNLLLGYTEILQGQIVADDGIGFNPDLEAYPYDPDRARELLAEAGYPDGFEFTMTNAEGRYVKSKEIGEAIAGQLADVGVTVNIEMSEHGTMVEAAGEQTLQTYYFGWNYFPVMDGDFVVQHYTCDGRYGLFCDEEYDALQAEQRSEPDPAKRAEIMADMQTILHDQAAALFLFQAPDVFGVNSRVHGFTPTPDNMIDFSTIWVDPSA
jgi:peptide/nickel transport system substrate-binding protein